MTIGYNPFDEDFNLEEFHEYRTMALSLREEKLLLLKRLDELKEDNRQLQEQVNELLNRRIKPKIFQCHADALENCPKVEQAVKDTAKEIFSEIGKLCDQLFNGKILTREFMAKYAELMKSKGVEVE